MGPPSTTPLSDGLPSFPSLTGSETGGSRRDSLEGVRDWTLVIFVFCFFLSTWKDLRCDPKIVQETLRVGWMSDLGDKKDRTLGGTVDIGCSPVGEGRSRAKSDRRFRPEG